MQCRLLGGVFSLVVQALLGITCIFALVIKRQNEIPRRDWYVWFLDVMKQGIGSSFGHFSNIFLSMVIAKSLSKADECQWYALTYVIDSVFGTILNLALLNLFESQMKLYPNCTVMNFGNYGNPPELIIWIPQLLVWLSFVVISKIIILFVVFQFIVPLNDLVSYAFHFLNHKPATELVVVMIVIPTILNTVQFWVTDTFLKGNNTVEGGSNIDYVRHAHSDEWSDYDLDEELLSLDVRRPSGRKHHETNHDDNDIEEEEERGNGSAFYDYYPTAPMRLLSNRNVTSSGNNNNNTTITSMIRGAVSRKYTAVNTRFPVSDRNIEMTEQNIIYDNNNENNVSSEHSSNSNSSGNSGGGSSSYSDVSDNTNNNDVSNDEDVESGSGQHHLALNIGRDTSVNISSSTVLSPSHDNNNSSDSSNSIVFSSLLPADHYSSSNNSNNNNNNSLASQLLKGVHTVWIGLLAPFTPPPDNDSMLSPTTTTTTTTMSVGTKAISSSSTSSSKQTVSLLPSPHRQRQQQQLQKQQFNPLKTSSEQVVVDSKDGYNNNENRSSNNSNNNIYANRSSYNTLKMRSVNISSSNNSSNNRSITTNNDNSSSSGSSSSSSSPVMDGNNNINSN